MLSLILVPLIVSADAPPPANQPNVLLKVSGGKSTRFFGYCISDETSEKKTFEGQTPAEINLDIAFNKCVVDNQGSSSPIKLRFFQNRKLIQKSDIQPGVAGVEIVIPLSFGKKKGK